MTDEMILSQLRHMYRLLFTNSVMNQQDFANNFVSPIITALEHKQQDDIKRLARKPETLYHKIKRKSREFLVTIGTTFG